MSDTKVVGFKLFPEHMRRSRQHAALLTRTLSDPHITKVVLRRENQLALAKSRLRATTSGKYTHAMLNDVGVHIAPDELQQAIDTNDEFYDFLRKATAGQGVVEVSYESLCEAPLEEPCRVCARIGAEPPAELPKNIFRPQTRGGGSACDGIANWQELKRAFEYSEHACDFE